MRYVLKYFLIIVALIVISNNAHADGFNLHGFEQGMSVSEAEAWAKSVNGIFKADDRIINKGGYFFKTSETSNEVRLRFSESGKGLNYISHSFSGEFYKYIRHIEHLKKNGNLELINAWTDAGIGNDGTESVMMGTYLGKRSNDWVIEVILFGDENRDTNNYQIIYQIADPKNFCEKN